MGPARVGGPPVFLQLSFEQLKKAATQLGQQQQRRQQSSERRIHF